jgi:hypothetical protein
MFCKDQVAMRTQQDILVRLFLSIDLIPVVIYNFTGTIQTGGVQWMCAVSTQHLFCMRRQSQLPRHIGKGDHSRRDARAWKERA